MTQEQIDQILEGQKAIAEGINKLLALFTLEPLNDTTNPILNLGEAAKLLGTTSGQLSKACQNNEVPYRQLGSKYIFSRVALMAWLHNVNMSYLFERMEAIKKHNKEQFFGRDEDPTVVLENWIRFTINPVWGANEEFRMQYSDPAETPDRIDTDVAAALLGVPAAKVREWANGFLYYKTPVIREGSRFYFSREALLKWSETPDFMKLKNDYIRNSTINRERLKAAEARREAERRA